MRYLAMACFVAVLGASCTPPPGAGYGPFPSTPFSSFLTGNNPTPLPIGTPEPPVGSDEFLLTIQNEDDGGSSSGNTTDNTGGTNGTDGTDTDADTVLASSYVEVTRVRDGEQLALLELGPCQLGYVVIKCLDRPVRISAILPDMTESTRLLPAGSTCVDRTFYIVRTAVPITDSTTDGTDGTDGTTGTDGTDGTDNTDNVEYEDVYKLSEVNSMPRCSGAAGGTGGFGGFGGGN